MTPATVPVVTGGEPLTQHFARAGNPVCHMIPGIDITPGRVGSKLMLGTTGPQRLSDPAYKGHATIVREYIVESILTRGSISYQDILRWPCPDGIGRSSAPRRWKRSWRTWSS